jgi:hypothetical protein
MLRRRAPVKDTDRRNPAQPPQKLPQIARSQIQTERPKLLTPALREHYDHQGDKTPIQLFARNVFELADSNTGDLIRQTFLNNNPGILLFAFSAKRYGNLVRNCSNPLAEFPNKTVFSLAFATMVGLRFRGEQCDERSKGNECSTSLLFCSRIK